MEKSEPIEANCFQKDEDQKIEISFKEKAISLE
jgi:hypothetical protein